MRGFLAALQCSTLSFIKPSDGLQIEKNGSETRIGTDGRRRLLFSTGVKNDDESLRFELHAVGRIAHANAAKANKNFCIVMF